MLAALASSSTAFQVPSKLSVSKVAEAVAPVLAAGVLVTGAMPAFAGDASAGEKIFSGNCAACHAGGQNVIMPEKTLEQSALEQYLDGGFNEGAVVKQVTNGENAMPAFGGRLSDNDIKNVSEKGWVKSQRQMGPTMLTFKSLRAAETVVFIAIPPSTEDL